MAPERSAPELNNNHAALEKQVTTASSVMLATGRNYSPIDKIVTLEP